MLSFPMNACVNAHCLIVSIIVGLHPSRFFIGRFASVSSDLNSG
jgi:hypothetical protein